MWLGYAIPPKDGSAYLAEICFCFHLSHWLSLVLISSTISSNLRDNMGVIMQELERYHAMITPIQITIHHQNHLKKADVNEKKERKRNRNRKRQTALWKIIKVTRLTIW
jgi:hypothetical protein